jgi:hypothetical protein
MKEINQRRRVVSALQETDFLRSITQDIADIIVGYRETSGRGPSIHTLNGEEKKIYHTAESNLPELPGLHRSRSALYL